MNHTAHIAKHLRDVYFGQNWTSVSLQELLGDVDWKSANAQVHSFHTIAKLSFHIHYFVSAILGALHNGSLDAHDKYSFDCPPIRSDQDWQQLKETIWSDVKRLVSLIESFPDDRLEEVFVDEKYGTYYRNFQGLIEHTHYHLGQIAIIKSLLKIAEES